MKYIAGTSVVISILLAGAPVRAESGVPAPPPATPPPAAASKTCVPDGELVPGDIPNLERAATQDHNCNVILDKARGSNLPDQWCGGSKDKVKPGWAEKTRQAIAFCGKPFHHAPPSGEDLDTARTLLELPDAERCGGGGDLPLRGDRATAQAIPSLAPSLVDAVVRGVADFVVARVKAELQAFLIDRLSNQLCRKSQAGGLFSASCKLLTAEKPDAVAWGVLKVAFEMDMERFPERALACVAARATTTPPISKLVYLATAAVRLIHHGADPRSVLAGLQGQTPTEAQCTADRYSCGLHMIGYTVGLLAPGRRPRGETLEPTDEQRFWNIAVIRWWAHATQIGFVTGELGDRSSALEHGLRSLREEVNGVVATFEKPPSEPDKAAPDKAAPDKAKQRASMIIRSARESVLLVNGWLAEVSEVLDEGKRAEWRASLGKVRVALKIVADSIDVYTLIENHDFAHVYFAVAAIVAELIKEKLGSELDKKVQKYLPFIAEIAAAKTADDVKRTLESFAAPVGAGRAKRGADRRTVALTAFPGVTAGSEWTYRLDRPASRGAQGGLFLPVGVDLSWGVGESHSFGAFLSIIDIGALATFREEDEDQGTGMTVERTPQVGLKQVFSPGAYIVWGWDRFAFGVGASLGPELRKISMDGTLVENASALRVGAFAAIDVTIFPF